MPEIWRAKPCGWSARERVVELGVTFGPAGPMVLDYLEERAKLENDAGRIRSGVRAVERGAFLRGGMSEAADIIKHAAMIGALDELEMSDDGREFTCRVSGFQSDQTLGRAASRQAAKRDRDADETRVTDSEPSRLVTERHASVKTVEDSTEQTTTPKAPTGGKVVTFNRRRVPDERLSLAVAVLDDFNDQAGTSFAAYCDDGSATDSLTRIISALTRFPAELSGDTPRRLTAATLRSRWWGTGPPSVGVVFGKKVIEQNLARLSSVGRSQPGDLAASIAKAYGN